MRPKPQLRNKRNGIVVNLSVDEAATVEAYMEVYKVSRSEAIRQMIRFWEASSRLLIESWRPQP